MQTSKKIIEADADRLPQFVLINDNIQLNDKDLTSFIHNHVEYNGTIKLIGPCPISVRILIIQRSPKNEFVTEVIPNSMNVFGTWFPFIATPLLPEWKVIIDNVYIAQGKNMEVGVKSDFTNNISVQLSTARGQDIISGDLYFCWYSDLETRLTFAKFDPICTCVIGTVSSM